MLSILASSLLNFPLVSMLKALNISSQEGFFFGSGVGKPGDGCKAFLGLA